jgi:hypothetical protein
LLQADTQTELNGSAAQTSLSAKISEASSQMPGPLGKLGVPRSDFVRLLIQASGLCIALPTEHVSIYA